MGAEPEIYSEAVKSAKLLVDYLSRQGIGVDANIALVVMEANRKIRDNIQASPNEEAGFWEAYSKLAASAAPATVTSIKATIEPPVHSLCYYLLRCLTFRKFSTSAARWYAGKYGCCTLGIIIVLVVVQVYWSTGTSLLQKVEKEYGDVQVAVQKTEKGKPNAEIEYKEYQKKRRIRVLHGYIQDIEVEGIVSA